MPFWTSTSTSRRQASLMLLALVPSGRFMGSLTAVAVSERSASALLFVNLRPSATVQKSVWALFYHADCKTTDLECRKALLSSTMRCSGGRRGQARLDG